MLPIEFEVVDAVDVEQLTRYEYRMKDNNKSPMVERNRFRLGYMCTAAKSVQVTEVGFEVQSARIRQLDGSVPFTTTQPESGDPHIFLVNPESGKQYSAKEDRLVDNETSCATFVDLFWSGGGWQTLEVTGRFWVGNERGRRYSQSVKALFLSPPQHMEAHQIRPKPEPDIK
jgi:hypothetical protein